MGFNSELHAALSYIDKPYKDILTRIRKEHKRTEKAMLEHIIAQAAKEDKSNA